MKKIIIFGHWIILFVFGYCFLHIHNYKLHPTIIEKDSNIFHHCTTLPFSIMATVIEEENRKNAAEEKKYRKKKKKLILKISFHNLFHVRFKLVLLDIVLILKKLLPKYISYVLKTVMRISS